MFFAKTAKFSFCLVVIIVYNYFCVPLRITLRFFAVKYYAVKLFFICFLRIYRTTAATPNAYAIPIRGPGNHGFRVEA
jgi:hypothetical protein